MPDGRTFGKVLRFVVLGGANTVLTYLLLLGLTYVIDPRLAYTVAFAAGVLANIALTGRFVFGSRPSPRRRAIYAAWLVIVFLAGLGAVQLALVVGVTGGPLLAALPLLLTVPLNFFGGRLLLADPVPCPAAAEECLTR